MRAVLIAGYEMRFLKVIMAFKKFLQDEAGVNDVSVIRGPYKNISRVESVLCEKINGQNVEEGPLLVAYAGHGGKTGWSLSPGRPIFYEFLADLFSRYNGEMLFLNDCCFAGAVISFLEEKNISSEKFSLLAAVNAEEESYDGFVRRVMYSWRHRELHQPLATIAVSLLSFPNYLREGVRKRMIRNRREIFWGTRFDHRFYAQKARAGRFTVSPTLSAFTRVEVAQTDRFSDYEVIKAK